MQVSYEIGGISNAATNVINFLDIGGENDQTTVDNIAARWAGAMEDVINGDSAVEAGIRFVWPAADPTSELFGSNVRTPGTLGTDLYAASTAYRVDIAAGLGPSKRGHIYIPGVSEDEVGDAGLINPAHVTGIEAAIGGFITDTAVNDGFLLGVLSRVNLTISAVTGVTVSPYVRQQRRRMKVFTNG